MRASQKTMVKVFAIVFLLFVAWRLSVFSDFKEKYSTAPRSKNQMFLEQKQRERQDRLQKYCKLYNTSSIKQELNREALKHLIVNDDYKTVYCYIPKVACTQWKRVFLALNNVRNVTDGEVINNRTYYKFLDSYSDEEIKLRLQTYYKFFFVRSPTERLLSCFRDKFEREQYDKYYAQTFSKRIVDSFRRSIDPKSDNNVTFEKFVHYISTVGFNEDDHWATYDFICQPCVILYDFIGRFEDMSEEAPYILRQKGMDKVATFPALHTHNTKSKILEYYATIPMVKIVQLVKLYERDYEMFHFGFPGPLAQYLEGFLS